METNNVFQEMKKIFEFDTCQDVPDSALPYLLQCLVKERTNRAIALKCNKYFFYMDKRAMKYALHFGLNKNRQRFDAIKSVKREKDERLKYMIEYYDNEYSAKEIENNPLLLSKIEDEKFREEMATTLGLSKKESKELSTKYIEPEVTFKKPVTGLGAFFK